MIRPPFAYYGGKTTLAPVIADLLPAHQHYVEPFAGSMAVLLAKEASPWETVNDLDGDLMTFWRVLRERPVELERACVLTPNSRAEYQASCDTLPVDDLDRARLVWVRLTQGRSHSMMGRGWKHKLGPSTHDKMSGAARVAAFAGRLAPVAARLSTVTLECRDALDVIRDYGKHPDVCLYVDPPYLGSTRATNYRVEMTADDAHVALADALNECKASVVLSGYDAPLYTDLFDGWHRVDLAAPTTLSGDNDRVEVLWSNRPIGEPDLFSMLDGGAA